MTGLIVPHLVSQTVPATQGEYNNRKLDLLEAIERAAKAALLDYHNYHDQDIAGAYIETEQLMRNLAIAIDNLARLPDVNGWIKWGGGRCPVPPETIVDLSRPEGIRLNQRAGDYVWSWIAASRDKDITAYRIVRAG